MDSLEEVTMVVKPKILKDIEIEKNIHLLIIEEFGEIFIDIRKFYQGRPTKHGMKIRMSIFNKIKDLINYKKN